MSIPASIGRYITDAAKFWNSGGAGGPGSSAAGAPPGSLPFTPNLSGIKLPDLDDAWITNNMKKLAKGLEDSPKIKLPGLRLPPISIPPSWYANSVGLFSLMAIPGFAAGAGAQWMQRQTHTKQLNSQKEMLEKLFEKTFKFNKGLYGLLGAAGIGGVSLLVSKQMAANSARKAEAAKVLAFKAEAKAKIKQAKEEANAAIQAEEGKVAARAKEASKTLEERAKGTIEAIKMLREHRLEDIFGQPDAINKGESIKLRIIYPERLTPYKGNSTGRTFAPTLMTGPPGTGKTELVRAIASTAQNIVV
jgi:hypothetical protein